MLMAFELVLFKFLFANKKKVKLLMFAEDRPHYFYLNGGQDLISLSILECPGRVVNQLFCINIYSHSHNDLYLSSTLYSMNLKWRISKRRKSKDIKKPGTVLVQLKWVSNVTSGAAGSVYNACLSTYLHRCFTHTSTAWGTVGYTHNLNPHTHPDPQSEVGRLACEPNETTPI